MTDHQIGRVAALYRYPVKSMAAEPLSTADVGWQGIEGDRRWAFVQRGLPNSGFPWLTIREVPSMALYQARLTDPDHPDTSPTIVTSPAGRELNVLDPALTEELGHDSYVIRHGRGVFDAFPLSLISTGTIAALGGLTSMPLDPRRFRPNILVEFASDDAFIEDSLVGKEVRIGEMTMGVDKRDKRCVTINVDPVTSVKNHDVLRAVAQERQACLAFMVPCHAV